MATLTEIHPQSQLRAAFPPSRVSLGAVGGASCPALITEGARVPAVVLKCRVRDESIGGDNPFTVSLCCTCSSSVLCGLVQQDVDAFISVLPAVNLAQR